MPQHLALVSVVVRDYDAAIAFYIDKLGFSLEADHARGVVLVREPQVEAFGTVAVFQDLYGNLWDLIQPPTEGPA